MARDESRKQPQQPQGAGAGKKRYAPPRLVRYGEVRLLTQASTSGSNEGSGGSGIMMPSDRRLKENIVRMGEHPLGIGLYLFDYRAEHREACGHGRFFGVMADEVEQVLPQAVFVNAAGYKAVDYRLLAGGKPR